eukprot:UN15529
MLTVLACTRAHIKYPISKCNAKKIPSKFSKGDPNLSANSSGGTSNVIMKIMKKSLVYKNYISNHK